MRRVIVPSLPDLLDGAVGSVEPSFDLDEIITAAGRRRCTRRRRSLAVTAGAVALCGAFLWVATGQSHSSEVRTTTPSRPKSPQAAEIPIATLTQLRAAVGAWATFPVAAVPRPLVLVSEYGYRSSIAFDNETKDAFESGAFNEPASFPSAPPQAGGYPITTAADALATLRADVNPVVGPHPPPIPLTITNITLDQAAFETDRGILTLPAWTFTFLGVQGSAPVLAVAPSARFPTPAAALHLGTQSAHIASDDKTITVSFTGAAAGTGPCTADYTIDQLASDTAVAVSVKEHRHATGSETCLSIGYGRSATVTLKEPLGARVLVNATTTGPIAVEP